MNIDKYHFILSLVYRTLDIRNIAYESKEKNIYELFSSLPKYYSSLEVFKDEDSFLKMKDYPYIKNVFLDICAYIESLRIEEELLFLSDKKPLKEFILLDDFLVSFKEPSLKNDILNEMQINYLNKIDKGHFVREVLEEENRMKERAIETAFFSFIFNFFPMNYQKVEKNKDISEEFVEITDFLTKGKSFFYKSDDIESAREEFKTLLNHEYLDIDFLMRSLFKGEFNYSYVHSFSTPLDMNHSLYLLGIPYVLVPKEIEKHLPNREVVPYEYFLKNMKEIDEVKKFNNYIKGESIEKEIFYFNSSYQDLNFMEDFESSLSDKEKWGFLKIKDGVKDVISFSIISFLYELKEKKILLGGPNLFSIKKNKFYFKEFDNFEKMNDYIFDMFKSYFKAYHGIGREHSFLNKFIIKPLNNYINKATKLEKFQLIDDFFKNGGFGVTAVFNLIKDNDKLREKLIENAKKLNSSLEENLERKKQLEDTLKKLSIEEISNLLELMENIIGIGGEIDYPAISISMKKIMKEIVEKDEFLSIKNEVVLSNKLIDFLYKNQERFNFENNSSVFNNNYFLEEIGGWAFKKEENIITVDELGLINFIRNFNFFVKENFITSFSLNKHVLEKTKDLIKFLVETKEEVISLSKENEFFERNSYDSFIEELNSLIETDTVLSDFIYDILKNLYDEDLLKIDIYNPFNNEVGFSFNVKDFNTDLLYSTFLSEYEDIALIEEKKKKFNYKDFYSVMKFQSAERVEKVIAEIIENTINLSLPTHLSIEEIREEIEKKQEKNISR